MSVESTKIREARDEFLAKLESVPINPSEKSLIKQLVRHASDTEPALVALCYAELQQFYSTVGSLVWTHLEPVAVVDRLQQAVNRYMPFDQLLTSWYMLAGVCGGNELVYQQLRKLKLDDFD